MTKEVYDKSVATQELQLVGGWNKFAHYSVVYYLLTAPVIVIVYHLIALVQKSNYLLVTEEVWIILIPSVLAAPMYRIQRKRLKFRIIQTPFEYDQVLEIINHVAKESKWTITSSDKLACVAKNTSRIFLWKLG